MKLLLPLILLAALTQGCQSTTNKYAEANASINAITQNSDAALKEIAAARLVMARAGVQHLDNASGFIKGIQASIPAIVTALKQGEADAAWKAEELTHWFGPRFWGAVRTIAILSGVGILLLIVIFVFGAYLLPMAGPEMARMGVAIVHTAFLGLIWVVGKMSTKLATVIEDADKAWEAKTNAAVAKANAPVASGIPNTIALQPVATVGPLVTGQQAIITP